MNELDNTVESNNLDGLDEESQHATFPYLWILRIPDGQSRSEVFMKFLKNNGKNFN